MDVAGGVAGNGGLRAVVEAQSFLRERCGTKGGSRLGREAVVLQGDVLEVTVKVRQEGAVNIWLEGPKGVLVEVHKGELTSGVHALSVARPGRSGAWLAKLSCQGHRTERRFHV